MIPPWSHKKKSFLYRTIIIITQRTLGQTNVDVERPPI